MKLTRVWFPSFLVISFFILLCGPVSAAGSLDGKIFTGEFGNKGEAAGTKDDFVFKDGKFVSALCSTFGYGSGDYQTTAQGKTVNFESQITNAAGGKMDWKGAVIGDKIEGTFISQENGKSTDSWFKGVLKQ